MTAPSDRTPITIYSTWRGLFFGVGGPLVLIALSLAAFVSGSGVVLGSVLGALGLILGAFTGFDTPRRTEFSDQGIRRRCLLRTHELPWSRISQIRRLPGPLTPSRDPTGTSARRMRRPGGLMARAGRRGYQLVDTVESAEEYDELVRAMAAWCPQVEVLASRPPEETLPTSQYHRFR